MFIERNENATETPNYITNIHTNIKFTLEIEINNMINFLDLTINRHNISVSFSNKKTLKSKIGNSKDKISKLNESVIYKLSCSDCGTKIGHIIRHLNTRKKEHLTKT